MVALHDEEREEEPLHLVAPDMGAGEKKEPLAPIFHVETY